LVLLLVCVEQIEETLESLQWNSSCILEADRRGSLASSESSVWNLSQSIPCLEILRFTWRAT